MNLRRYLYASLAGATLLATAAPVLAGANCPDIHGIGSRLQSSEVAASFVSDGTVVTYTFDSLVDRSPSDGVPGLVGYCVYPTQPPGNPDIEAPAAVGADGSPFDVETGGSYFAFTRALGDPSNIPLDGTLGIAMGTATWVAGNAPGAQTILLHINDATECARLYGDDGSATCFVFPSPAPEPHALTVLKDATPSFDRTFSWAIAKSVDKALVEQVGGSATFNYTVSVTHDAGTDGNWRVTGNIVVTNPNAFPVTADVTDAVDNGGTCTVAGGAGAVVPGGSIPSPFTYTCTYAAAPSPASGTNTATVTWAKQGVLGAGSATYSIGFDFSSTTPTVYDACAAVSDTFAGSLGQVCVGDANPATFTYSRTILVPQYNCQFFPNTASFVTSSTGSTGSASQTVEVCGPARTGALTMGFWQNKNGQGILAGEAKTGICPSGVWLRQYAQFQDLSATATCSQVASYVYSIIKAANAAGAAMNAMLKAQSLATALDVYFSDPALGGNKIGAPAAIGGVGIDLTHICKLIDGSGGGACSGIYEDTSSAFGGAATLTVAQMLAYAASQSNAGGSFWYGQVKAVQGLAKDAFDAVNNQVAFAP